MTIPAPTRLVGAAAGLLIAAAGPAFAQGEGEQPAPSTTTVPSTSDVPAVEDAPTEGVGPSRWIGHRPIGTSSIVLFPAFLPEPFSPDHDLGLDAALEITGIEGPSGPARPLPLHPDPVTGGAPLLISTGGSISDQFVPPAILGVLIAWATVTLFEFRRRSEERAGYAMEAVQPTAD